MAYKGLAKKLLDKHGVEEGDLISFDTSEEHFEGALMPRTDSSDENHLIIKLPSGYNIGVEINGGEEIVKKRVPRQLAAFKKKVYGFKGGKPTLSFIHTGGTIGCKIDYKTGGVSALMEPKDVLATEPRISEIVNVKNVVSPFALDSADMSCEEWQKTAFLAAKELNSGVDGVVVTHGTDTLHYTAAALAFMLQNLNSPVVLTGAQRSPDRGSFDGALNLYCAARVAASDYAGVAIVMHESQSDNFCAILPATKTRKMHSSRRDAFKAINALPLGRVSSKGEITWLREYAKRSKEKKESVAEVKADTRFEKNVGLLKAHPNAQPELLDFLVERGARGVVLEGTGLGYVPTMTLNEKYSWLSAVKKAVEKGVLLAMTTQCLFGRVNSFVYSDLRLLSNAGVLYCEDMLPETAFVKLGCVLGRTRSVEEAKKMMLENWAGEMSERTESRTYM